MKIYIILGILSLSFLGACSKQVDATADATYQHTQGRVDKAKKEVKNAEDSAKERAKEAEDAIKSIPTE